MASALGTLFALVAVVAVSFEMTVTAAVLGGGSILADRAGG